MIEKYKEDPTISVEREQLFKALGEDFTDEGFDELCFDFGIELDEITSKAEISAKQHTELAAGEADAVIYKIDIPANRYDLLCLEGLANALNVFRKKTTSTVWKKLPQDASGSTKMVVKPETSSIRPYVVCAILRDVTLDQNAYQSFLDLQDHLHRNICRQRTLVAIGTHDLDAVKGPFTYEARKPEDIRFQHLFADVEMDGREMIEWFRTDPAGKHIKPYTDIIYDSPVYPVIYDAEGHVLSLPPLINGARSKISTATKNVFIECTATDKTKAKIVLDTIVCMFSQYCAKPGTVEQVDVVYEATGEVQTLPSMTVRKATATLSEIRSMVGVDDLEADQVCSLLDKMMLGPATYDAASDNVTVTVPPTRSDVLHACDIVEDVAIAYGYNNVPLRVPASKAPGKELPINQMTDLLRYEIAQAGYIEILSLGLCSHDENFKFMRRKDDGKKAVVLSNPQTVEFQIGRTSLVPGMLKTLCENRSMPFKDGVRLFEISDVMLLDETEDTGVRNERRIVALYSGMTAGNEIIHGLVDRIMQLVSVRPSAEYSPDGAEAAALRDNTEPRGEYLIKPSDEDGMYFPGRGANVVFRPKEGAEQTIGTFGIVHPEVLENFQLRYPCSMLELNMEVFL